MRFWEEKPKWISSSTKKKHCEPLQKKVYIIKIQILLKIPHSNLNNLSILIPKVWALFILSLIRTDLSFISFLMCRHEDSCQVINKRQLMPLIFSGWFVSEKINKKNRAIFYCFQKSISDWKVLTKTLGLKRLLSLKNSKFLLETKLLNWLKY